MRSFALLATVTGVALLAGCAAPDRAEDADPLSGTVTILAAASLADVFDDLAARFEAEHPDVDVVVSYGGSSALAE